MERRLVAAAAAIFVSLGAAASVTMEQLTERPLLEALAHPAIEYASRPTTDPIVELNRRIDEEACCWRSRRAPAICGRRWTH